MAFGNKKELPVGHLDTISLRKRINADSSAKLYLLYGPEEYLIEQIIELIKKTYISPDSSMLDFVKLDFEKEPYNVDKVIDNISMPPFMSDRRVAIVRNSSIFEGDYTKEMETLVNAIPDYSIVVFVLDKIDGRKKNLLKIFENNGIVASIAKENEEKLASFVMTKFSKRGLTISSENALGIVNRVDGFMRGLSLETNKIVDYCEGEGLTEVTFEIIDKLCPPDVSGTVFNIIDAIVRKDSGMAFTYLDNLLRTKEPLPKIRATFATNMKQLICARELNSVELIRSRMKVQDFIGRKLLNQSRNFDLDKLKSLYLELTEIDYNIKTSALDERTLIEQYIISSCL